MDGVRSFLRRLVAMAHNDRDRDDDNDPPEDEIRKEAFLLWQKAGSRHGDDPNKYWQQAKQKLMTGRR
jgi:hypothetical protein